MSQSEERVEAAERGPIRRRRFIVYPNFQYALIRLLVAVWIFNTCLVGWFLHYLYAGPVFDLRLAVNAPDVRVLDGSPPQFVVLMGLAALLCLLVVVGLGVHLSHQVAGPAFRINQSLKRVAAGDIDFRVSFRKSDYLGDLGDSLNGMLEALQVQAARELGALKAIEESLPENAIGRRRLRELRERRALQAGDPGEPGDVLVDGEPPEQERPPVALARP